jgi:hypothetical protein
MSPEAIRWVKVAGWIILIGFFGAAILTWALSWILIGLAIWGAALLGLRFGERMRRLRGQDSQP